MNTERFSAVILAAGKSTRFSSKHGVSKVLYPLAGVPMIEYVLRTLHRLAPNEIIIVMNPETFEEFHKLYGDIYKVAIQDPPLGTGDALATALPHIESDAEYVLVLPGDAPLISEKAITTLLKSTSGGEGAVLTFHPPSTYGYGRILRDEDGYFVSRIVEELDADDKTVGITECNSGVYAFQKKWLADVLERTRVEFGTKNAKGEYYLTDVMNFLRITPVFHEPYEDLIGINDRAQLNQAENLLQERIISAHAKEGVTFIRAETSYVEANVTIGADTIIYPGCVLRGDTSIGENCEVGPMCYIENSRIGNHNKIIYAHLVGVHTEDNVKVGPFANLRPGTHISENAKVGDFVEIKNSRIGAGSKVPHLTYIGDSEIGEGVNIGAGTITCNYDGFEKHKTIIEDNVFIGSNNTLIAPLRIGRGAYTAGGSTINQDVPEDALGIGRAKQEIKEGYAKKLRERKAKKTSNIEESTEEPNST